MISNTSKTISRRSFIKTTLTGIAALVTINNYDIFAGNQKQMAHWAFLADTHIAEDLTNVNQGFNPADNLKQVISSINTDLPDAIAIAGDLAFKDGQPGDYEAFKTLVNPVFEKRPVFMALGNHDDRNNFLNCFDEISGDRKYVRDKHITIIDNPPVRIIILDSLFFVDESPGLLGKAQRQWLGNYLNSDDNVPTIILLHHSLGDGDHELLDVPYLFEMVKPVRKVKAIIYGHSHNYKIAESEGIHLINIPAVAYTFSRNEPVGWMDAKLSAQGGDFTLHSIGGNQQNDGTVSKLLWR